ncbi:MAG: hypothetical protein NTNFB02_26250 [Nitrospira sp.]
MKKRRAKLEVALAAIPFLLAMTMPPVLHATEPPPAEPEYRKFFAHFVDKRSYKEKVLNLIGLTKDDVGRSFALIAGVSDYPRMPPLQKELAPAAEDLRKVEDYLKNVEFFDEIVVLRNQEVSLENFRYFLQSYFPQRLKNFPKSRFLFVYSGHGFNEGQRSYLVESNARNLRDREHSINLGHVKEWIDEVVDAGHHVLVLLNACYSGAFLKRGFGEGSHYVPKYAGAHAITAGGTKEQAWHDPSIGDGSIFFEKLFAGLEGRADTLPRDGVVTVDEIATYLKYEVTISTDQTQNPQFGDISKNGSLGGFFFLNRLKPVEAGVMTAWNPSKSLAFGAHAGQSTQEAGAGGMQQARLPSAGVPGRLESAFTGKDGAPMVLIPEGEFLMGSNDGDADENPERRVNVNAFYMDKYEVSTRLYSQFLQTTSRKQPDDWSQQVALVGSGDRPVVQVSWHDADDYCKSYGKRLPTEQEWEKAARGTDGRRYPWGNEEPTSRHALFDTHWNGYGTLAVIGSYEAGMSPYGVHDLAGNVWEWTSSDYDQSRKVFRGGSWGILVAGGLRATFRDWYTPMLRSLAGGFRCAQDVPK